MPSGPDLDPKFDVLLAQNTYLSLPAVILLNLALSEFSNLQNDVRWRAMERERTRLYSGERGSRLVRAGHIPRPAPSAARPFSLVYRPWCTYILTFKVLILSLSLKQRLSCLLITIRAGCLSYPWSLYDPKTHKRLKERFLIRWNRTKRANFQCNYLFWATYNTTENN